MNEPRLTRTDGPDSVESVLIPADRINEPGSDDEWSDWIRQAASGAVGQVLALDLGNVTRLGSLGLNRLIQLNRVVRQHGLEVILVNVQPPISEVLALTRMDRLFRPIPGSSRPIPGSSRPIPGSSRPDPGPSRPDPGPSRPDPKSNRPDPGTGGDRDKPSGDSPSGDPRVVNPPG